MGLMLKTYHNKQENAPFNWAKILFSPQYFNESLVTPSFKEFNETYFIRISSFEFSKYHFVPYFDYYRFETVGLHIWRVAIKRHWKRNTFSAAF